MLRPVLLGAVAVLILCAARSRSGAVATADPEGDMPVFNAGTDTLVYETDFDDIGTLQEQWDNAGAGGEFWPSADPPGIPEEIITPGYNGSSQAIRMNYPGGAAQFACDWNQGVQGVAIGNAATIHVFEYYARVIFAAPGLQSGDTLGVKWAMIRHPTGDRIQWHMHNANSSINCSFTTAGEPFTLWQTMDLSQFSDCQSWAPIGPRIEDVDDGNWHHFVHRYKCNPNGYSQMWIDGVKVVSARSADLGVVPVGAHNDKPYCAQDDLDELGSSLTSAEITFGSVQTTDTPAWTYDIGYFRRWREAGT